MVINLVRVFTSKNRDRGPAKRGQTHRDRAALQIGLLLVEPQVHGGGGAVIASARRKGDGRKRPSIHATVGGAAS
jgi:hypothetical protein